MGQAGTILASCEVVPTAAADDTARPLVESIGRNRLSQKRPGGQMGRRVGGRSEHPLRAFRLLASLQSDGIMLRAE